MRSAAGFAASGRAGLAAAGNAGRAVPWASGDLWEHVLRVLDLLGEGPSFPLAFAALLHDVGKPRTVGRTPERYTFYGHEHVGRRMASEICLRLKTSNEERERVEWLVEKHQILADVRQMRTSKVKTLLAHPGIRELLALHRADALASGKSDDHVVYCEQLLREWSADDLEPAAAVDRPRPATGGLAAGADLQAAARRRARGAAGRDDQDGAGGAGVGGANVGSGGSFPRGVVAECDMP